MDELRQALCEALAAAESAGALTDDEREELLTHLEETVEAEMLSGMERAAAIELALRRLGDTTEVVRDLRTNRSAAHLALAEGDVVPVRQALINAGACATAISVLAAIALLSQSLVTAFAGHEIALPAVLSGARSVSSMFSGAAWGVLAVILMGGLFTLARRRQWTWALQAFSLCTGAAALMLLTGLGIALGTIETLR